MKAPASPPAVARPPHRTPGFWSATALVIASMLGTGVFTTSGGECLFLSRTLHPAAGYVTGLDFLQLCRLERRDLSRWRSP